MTWKNPHFPLPDHEIVVRMFNLLAKCKPFRPLSWQGGGGGGSQNVIMLSILTPSSTVLGLHMSHHHHQYCESLVISPYHSDLSWASQVNLLQVLHISANSPSIVLLQVSPGFLHSLLWRGCQPVTTRLTDKQYQNKLSQYPDKFCLENVHTNLECSNNCTNSWSLTTLLRLWVLLGYWLP